MNNLNKIKSDTYFTHSPLKSTAINSDEITEVAVLFQKYIQCLKI